MLKVALQNYNAFPQWIKFSIDAFLDGRQYGIICLTIKEYGDIPKYKKMAKEMGLKFTFSEGKYDDGRFERDSTPFYHVNLVVSERKGKK